MARASVSPKPARFNQEKGKVMTTIILIVVLVLLFGGGGGYYWSRGRR
jgi:hypothetical protein